jgi:uncharacterized protein YjbJ (UPF0337 family)
MARNALLPEMRMVSSPRHRRPRLAEELARTDPEMFEVYPSGSWYLRRRLDLRALNRVDTRRDRLRSRLMGLGKKAKDRAKIVKGKTKKHAGKATGSKRLTAKGKAGEIAGKLKLKGEKAKHPAKH